MGRIHERACKRWNGTIPFPQPSPSFVRISSRSREEASVTALPRLQPERVVLGRVGRGRNDTRSGREWGLDSDKPRRLVD